MKPQPKETAVWNLMLHVEDSVFDQIVKAVAMEVEKRLNRKPFEPEFYTPKEVARLIGCTANNVRKKCLAGKFSYVKNGKSILIAKNTVDMRIKKMHEEGKNFWD